MFLPTTIGLDAPAPGKAVFHATFFVALQVVGKSVSGAIPKPPGPRKPGQSAASPGAANSSNPRTNSGYDWLGMEVPRTMAGPVSCGGCTPFKYSGRATHSFVLTCVSVIRAVF